VYLQVGWGNVGYRTATVGYALLRDDAERFSGGLRCTDQPQVIDVNLLPE